MFEYIDIYSISSVSSCILQFISIDMIMLQFVNVPELKNVISIIITLGPGPETNSTIYLTTLDSNVSLMVCFFQFMTNILTLSMVIDIFRKGPVTFRAIDNS